MINIIDTVHVGIRTIVTHFRYTTLRTKVGVCHGEEHVTMLEQMPNF